MRVSGSNLSYMRQPDGTWRSAMPLPFFDLFCVHCTECGRRFYAWGTNKQIEKYEAHWLKVHDDVRPNTWGGVTT